MGTRYFAAAATWGLVAGLWCFSVAIASTFDEEPSGPAIDWAHYGYLIPEASSETLRVWWCEAGWKVGRSRPVPTAEKTPVELAAAGNDWEAVQIVLSPTADVEILKARCDDFRGPGEARIPAGNTRILWAYYHWVEHPTDRTGRKGWWPDALPPLKEPVRCAAGENLPLWMLVYVPAGTPAGVYTTTLVVETDRGAAKVPVRLRVWGFALPERNHLETAFGFDPWLAFRYHQVESESDRRALLDLYWQTFAEHRISPFNPAPLDPFHVKFIPDADPPRAEVDFSAWEREMRRVIERYRFTNFVVPVHGMGGGTFHERWEPQILGFGEDTPQYHAMFSSFVGQLEDVLRRNGWLKMAYVYWFDEPEPKDYEFVTKGMERLKKYAPGLQRMLTEEPNDKLQAPVDIWCPITPNYNHEVAEQRRARGERFWWYVCTGPRAPYCTLFIDHPGTELRVWLWQTWERNIVGILVWQVNYWTSPTAFPDSLQNPYEDPMAYVSGYSTPVGTKRHWGNGDGRFIYPPLAAVFRDKSGPGPVLEPPVSSIRWEMLREGVEDYEMLYLLRQLVEEKRAELPAERVSRYESLLRVPAEITRSMTAFTFDPRVILARRAAIAEAIEELVGTR